MSFKSLLLFVSLSLFAGGASASSVKIDGTEYQIGSDYANYDGWQFTSNGDGTYNLVYAPVKPNITTLTVPNKIEASDGTSITISGVVRDIQEGVFSGSQNIEKVIISSGIKTVGSNAFAWCTKVSNVTFDKPCAVEVIGDYAFQGCSSLKSIKIPEGVTKIGASAFVGCSALKTVTFPSTLKEIGSNAFKECKNLESADLPANLETIGSYAFCQCQSLTSVTIPASVKVVGQCAYQFCYKITSITIEDSETNTDRVIEQWAFNQTAITSIYIPGSISVIEENAFAGSHELTTIVLGDGVDEVKKDAFSDCNVLLKIKLESKTTPPDLDPSAFTWHRIENGNVTVEIPEDASYSYNISGGSVQITAKADPTAIKNNALSAQPVAYYALTGAKLTAPKSGVVIVVYSDGSREKVLFK